MELLKRPIIAAAIGAGTIVLLARILLPNGLGAHLASVLVYLILCEIIPLFIVILGLARPLRGGHRVSFPQAIFVGVASIGRWAILSASALLGGMLIVSALGIGPVSLGFERVLGAVTFSLMAIGLGKAAAFGLVIALGPTARRALSCALVEVAAIMAVITVGNALPLLDAREPFLVYAISGDSYGVTVGSPVKVHGVEVGRVTEVALVHDVNHPDKPVRLTLKVNDLGASFLGEDTVAHVERIHFGPGIPPFATAPVALYTSGTAPLPSGASVSVVGDETMVESFAKLAGEFSAVRKQLEDLHGLFDVAEKLLRDPATIDAIPTLTRDARATMQDLRALIAETRKVSGQTPATIAAIESASREGQSLLKKLDRAALEIPRILASTERTLALAEDLATNLRAASREAPALARSASAALDETDRAVIAAQRSVLLRGTLPARPDPKREAEVRPSLPALGSPP